MLMGVVRGGKLTAHPILFRNVIAKPKAVLSGLAQPESGTA